tara:strand:+ start:992 stop:1426 length:435 start_codon:yes stop_codon:yes gene_type:complete
MSIATIIAFVLRYKKWFMYGAAAVAVLLALWAIYSHVWHKGYDAADQKWKVAQEAAQAKAAADTKLLQDAISEIDASVTTDMEIINAVRVVYRDKIRTVAIAADRPDCALADGLREQINAAATAYASGASGAGNGTVRPAKPSP